MPTLDDALDFLTYMVIPLLALGAVLFGGFVFVAQLAQGVAILTH